MVQYEGSASFRGSTVAAEEQVAVEIVVVAWVRGVVYCGEVVGLLVVSALVLVFDF